MKKEQNMSDDKNDVVLILGGETREIPMDSEEYEVIAIEDLQDLRSQKAIDADNMGAMLPNDADDELAETTLNINSTDMFYILLAAMMAFDGVGIDLVFADEQMSLLYEEQPDAFDRLAEVCREEMIKTDLPF
jgi:hypothetical protein